MRRHVLAGQLLLLVGFCLAQSGPAPAADAAGKRVVLGTVNGEPLTIRRQDSTALFVFQNLREPSSPEDYAEIAAEDQRETCGALRKAITTPAMRAELARLNISATEAEAEQYRQELVAKRDPASPTLISDQVRLISTALAEVYEQGADPAQVYRDSLEPKGIPLNGWAAYLHEGRSPEYRARLASGRLINDPGTPEFDWRKDLMSVKLGQEVDALIGERDPEFASYLEKSKAAKANHVLPFEDAATNYVLRARAAWWAERYAKLKVTLNDPSLADTCHLSEIGVTVQK